VLEPFESRFAPAYGMQNKRGTRLGERFANREIHPAEIAGWCGGGVPGGPRFKGARGYGAAAITLKPLCSVAACVPVRRRLLTLLDCCSSDHRLKPVLLEEGEKQVPRLGSAAGTKKDRKNGHGCPVPLRPVLGAVTSTRKKGASLWT
jgi:hypothetical protein